MMWNEYKPVRCDLGDENLTRELNLFMAIGYLNYVLGVYMVSQVCWKKIASFDCLGIELG